MSPPAERFAPRALLLALLLASVSGCRTTGDFMWVETLPLPVVTPGGDYVIAPGDVISVRVLNHDNVSTRARVRADGRITLPFLNDVEAAALAPTDLARRLQVKLKEFIVNPVVTVSFEERPAVRVSVVGEVGRPGVYDLEQGAGVLQAIASAGGLTQFAGRDRIYVLRPNYWADGSPTPARIRFRLSSLTQGSARAASFTLRSGDTLVIE